MYLPGEFEPFPWALLLAGNIPAAVDLDLSASPTIELSALSPYQSVMPYCLADHRLSTYGNRGTALGLTPCAIPPGSIRVFDVRHIALLRYQPTIYP